MLRLFVRNGSAKLNLPGVQLYNSYTTKKTGKDELVQKAESKEVSKPRPKFENVTVEPEHPNKRIMQCLRRDQALMKQKLMFWRDFKNPALDDEGNVIDWDDPNAPIFSNHCDVVIIGGGAIGSAAAYFCKKMMRGDLRVVVVEKDPQYKKASTVLSVGGLRQQFSLEENIEMSLFGAEFLRDINDYLGIDGEPPVDVQFHPYGYLTLATAEKADILYRNSELQRELGAKNVLMSANQLKSKFPWLTTDGIELGCLGLENEGWFDPWLLLDAFRKKAISMGVEYVTAEAIGFNIEKDRNTMFAGVPAGEYEQIDYLVVKTRDGVRRPIHFAKCVVAAGPFSADIARMAKIGYGPDMLSVPLPVEPRKRYVYCFHAPDGPNLNTPMTIDPTGVYFRREGLDNNYICGRCPSEDEEPPIDNLDVDPDFFDNRIWPVLAERVKAFENLKVKSSWAGYYEYNTYDENGIIGLHPYHDRVIFATGFSGHGIQQAPAVGRAVSELVMYNNFATINLNRLAFDRFITLEPMRESNIW